LDDLGVVASQVDPDQDVEADLVLEAISGGVIVTGTVDVPWKGECRRCLRPVAGRVRLRVRELFADDDEDPDAYPLAGDEIDLEPMLRDAAAGALPLAPLCEEGCRGPAPDQFPTGADAEEKAARDPRWAALDELDLDD
jgi:uncharacterized protein